MTPPAAAQDITWTPDAAYRYCERLARTHYENFTVGSWLLPRDKRRHVHAIYGYCRTVDDLGDEVVPPTVPEPAGGEGAAPGEAAEVHRLDLLDQWQTELEACYSGTPSHPVLVALQETIRRFAIPREPFLKLIDANRMDQRHKRHPTYRDLLDYCDHSANPVGHLFLYLFGYRDPERQRISDATCTALQLANFWQDVARDYRKGRIYLPLEDLTRFGYSEAELARGLENEAFRNLVSFEVDRTMGLFREGARLVNLLDGPVKLDVALFTRGGVAILEAIRRQNYNVLTNRPKLSPARKAELFWSTWLTWRLGSGLGLPGQRHSRDRP